MVGSNSDQERFSRFKELLKVRSCREKMTRPIKNLDTTYVITYEKRYFGRRDCAPMRDRRHQLFDHLPSKLSKTTGSWSFWN